MRTLITGANGGFGHLATLSLARAGHDVIATMRNLDKGDALRAALDAEGLSAEFRRLDVCDEDSVREAIGDANELDAVVNNAGFEVRAPIEEVDDDLVVAQFDTNVRGPMRVMRAVLPAWRERGSGVIVNVTSVAGVVGVPFGGIYAASKHALEGITESMFWEVSPFGIRLALIEPGAFETEFEANTVNPPGWDTSPYRANADRFRESMGNLSGGVPRTTSSWPTPSSKRSATPRRRSAPRSAAMPTWSSTPTARCPSRTSKPPCRAALDFYD